MMGSTTNCKPLQCIVWQPYLLFNGVQDGVLLNHLLSHSFPNSSQGFQSDSNIIQGPVLLGFRCLKILHEAHSSIMGARAGLLRKRHGCLLIFSEVRTCLNCEVSAEC